MKIRANKENYDNNNNDTDNNENDNTNAFAPTTHKRATSAWTPAPLGLGAPVSRISQANPLLVPGSPIGLPWHYLRIFSLALTFNDSFFTNIDWQIFISDRLKISNKQYMCLHLFYFIYLLFMQLNN